MAVVRYIMPVIEKRVVASSTAQETLSGLTVRDRYLISGIDRNSTSPLLDALLTDGLPVLNQSHPTYPSIRVLSRVPTPFLNSPDQAYVDIEYGFPDFAALENAPSISFRAITREVQTSVRVDRQPIYVYYKPTVSKTDKDGKQLDAYPRVIGRVSDVRPLGLLTYRWMTGTAPTNLLPIFGTANDSPWRGGEKYTWMFADLSIDKIVYRTNWMVSASFLYDPETFVKTAFYRLPNGDIPFDVKTPIDPTANSGNGWTNRFPREGNFNVLNLPQGL